MNPISRHCAVAALALPLIFSTATAQDMAKEETVTISVNPEYFIKENLLGDILKEERTLSGGKKTLCYIIKTHSLPHEHEMGPWAPRHITDDKEKGGIWFKDGKVYDVDGPFVKNMATFYNDPQWKLYNDDGSVKVAFLEKDKEGSDRPNFDPTKYKNHCVECPPETFKHLITTYIIPVTPVAADRPFRLGREGAGVAFNGVNFDPPAPLDRIIRTISIGPFDDHGGHANPHSGYHYHAATGSTKEIGQKDDHAPMIGYALDGYGIFAHLDKEGNKPAGLDNNQGHYDETRGYHYHAAAPGENKIIGGFHGIPGSMSVK